MNLIGQIESILFVASKPVSVRHLVKAVSAKTDDVIAAVAAITEKYNREDSGIQLFRQGDDVQFATNPAHAEAIADFVKEEAVGELTRAQLETLTVIAYRTPVTRPELEQIRGVNCAIIIRNLMMRGLIDEQDDPVKAMSAYVLSFEALANLGIRSVAELPEYEKLHGHKNIEKILEQNQQNEKS